MDRAVTPVVAICLLIGITVLGAAGVASVAGSLDAAGPAREVPAALALSADAADQRLTLTNRGTDPIDVRNCTVTVTVDGEPLAHQPPVPYFAATGFQGTPTGPFNAAADPTWSPGESTSVQLASTNHPRLTDGARVTVTVERDGERLASAGARVR